MMIDGLGADREVDESEAKESKQVEEEEEAHR